ncbi:MAG: polysaccharide biosynthesis/export family protein [Planctomycetes bacterium]|nr:polysaccharide biosynthesis/export family protein [Planctomycetota bacterium]
MILLLTLVSCMEVGCSSLTTPISGVPARRLPPQFFATPKNNLVPIDISRLTQEPPREYILGNGDILGVYIEGILPTTKPDQAPELPPVHFPEKDSTLPPSLGFPVPIVEDGTISLPLIKPLPIAGMTLQQVRELIRRSYFESKILTDTQARVFTPIVSLIQKRSYNIVVVRQDGGGMSMSSQMFGGRGGFTRGSDQSAMGRAVKLQAYENDVLHALMETGGLPGVNAKNEVKILRASRSDKLKRDEFIRQFYATFYDQNNCNPCVCPPPLPDDPSIVKIPLRLPPGVVPSFRPEEIILNEGDVVYIESRETEVFYTGGMLPGGEWPLPRDYDLDVLGAMALAGRGVASNMGMGGGGMGNVAMNIGGVPPGRLYILRKTPCNGQIAIEVDLARAINNPRERPLVQPGDTLILQYKPEEEVLNFGLGTFFTFGIQELLRN